MTASDTLIGGAGADILNGGAGKDQLSDIDGGGTLSGEAGDDTIHLFDTLVNDTTVTGGAGQDRLELLHLDYKSNYDSDSDYWDIVKTDAGYTLNIGTAHDDISQSITQRDFVADGAVKTYSNLSLAGGLAGPNGAELGMILGAEDNGSITMQIVGKQRDQ